MKKIKYSTTDNSLTKESKQQVSQNSHRNRDFTRCLLLMIILISLSFLIPLIIENTTDIGSFIFKLSSITGRTVEDIYTFVTPEELSKNTGSDVTFTIPEQPLENITNETNTIEIPIENLTLINETIKIAPEIITGPPIGFTSQEAFGSTSSNYGYNSTSQVMTDTTGLTFKRQSQGVITINNERYLAFGLTGTVNNINYTYLSLNFNWNWDFNQTNNDYVFWAENDDPNIVWKQYYYFYESTSKQMKVKHYLKNNLSQPIQILKCII